MRKIQQPKRLYSNENSLLLICKLKLTKLATLKLLLHLKSSGGFSKGEYCSSVVSFSLGKVHQLTLTTFATKVTFVPLEKAEEGSK